MKVLKRSDSGFTLIEIMVVLILLSLSFMVFLQALNTGKSVRVNSEIRTIQAVLLNSIQQEIRARKYDENSASPWSQSLGPAEDETTVTNFDDIDDFRLDGRFQGVHGNVAARAGVKDEPAWAAIIAAVISPRRDGGLVLYHEAPIQTAGRAAAENVRQDLERIDMGLIPPLKGGRQEAAPPGRLADPLIAQDDLAGRFLWRLLGAVPNHRRLGWDLAVVLLCQRFQLFLRDRPGDY